MGEVNKTLFSISLQLTLVTLLSICCKFVPKQELGQTRPSNSCPTQSSSLSIFLNNVKSQTKENWEQQLVVQKSTIVSKTAYFSDGSCWISFIFMWYWMNAHKLKFVWNVGFCLVLKLCSNEATVDLKKRDWYCRLKKNAGVTT